MFAIGSKHRENVGRNPCLVVVHPVVHQHIAADVNVGEVSEPQAQCGCGLDHCGELEIVIGHRFAVRVWILDAQVIFLVLGGRFLGSRGYMLGSHKRCAPAGTFPIG